MSSGDMTTYVRGKQEERGNTNYTFMTDGFDRWAESDAPNRVGGMYKEPAQRTHRRRRGRGLDTFDSESDSCSDSEDYGRRTGKGRYISDSSDFSDSSYSSDSSEELSGGRRRRRRRSHSRYSDSGSDDDVSDNESMVRRAGGDLPNIVKYADMAQQGYDLVKSYLPDSAKQYVDKIFGLYNTIRVNAKLFKTVLSSVTGSNATGAIKIKEKIEQLGFGRMPMKHSYKAMKMLDKKSGSRTHRLLKKMFGAGFLTDQAGDLAYEIAPFGKDTAKSLARSAVDKLISTSATAKKIDGFVESGVEMYNNVKANMPAIRSAMNTFKTKVPNAGPSIDKADNALKTVGLGRKGKRAPSQRNMMVSKLMREKGLTLGEASKQVSAMLKRGGDL
jgi:hypothetical protein|nr:MAG: hypothetical protein [Lake Baikal virophage 3]